MKKFREKKVESSIVNCINILNKAKLSREELIVVLGQLLIRSGYSIHYLYEEKDSERPDKINQETANKLYFKKFTTGTTLMKVGFDLQDTLLLKN
jgi:hypothetical protein